MYALLATACMAVSPGVLTPQWRQQLVHNSMPNVASFIDRYDGTDPNIRVTGLHPAEASLQASGFEVTRTDGKYYRVVWTDSVTDADTGQPRVLTEMRFPVLYTLILGSDPLTLEQALADTLETKSLNPTHAAPDISVTPKEWRAMRRDGVFTAGGNHRPTSLLTDRTFFTLDATGLPVPLLSPGFPIESLTNMFLIPSLAPDTPVDLRIQTYKATERRLTLPLGTLLGTLADNGCTLHAGPSALNDSIAGIHVHAFSDEAGYEHLMRVTMPRRAPGDTTALRIAVDMTPYVSTSQYRAAY